MRALTALCVAAGVLACACDSSEEPPRACETREDGVYRVAITGDVATDCEVAPTIISLDHGHFGVLKEDNGCTWSLSGCQGGDANAGGFSWCGDAHWTGEGRYLGELRYSMVGRNGVLLCVGAGRVKFYDPDYLDDAGVYTGSGGTGAPW